MLDLWTREEIWRTQREKPLQQTRTNNILDPKEKWKIFQGVGGFKPKGLPWDRHGHFLEQHNVTFYLVF